MRVVNIVKFKGLIIDTCIFSIIKPKLGHWEKSCQIILLKTNKDLEICLYCIILSINLTISKKIKYSKKFLLET